jgi:hypothetical protein
MLFQDGKILTVVAVMLLVQVLRYDVGECGVTEAARRSLDANQVARVTDLGDGAGVVDKLGGDVQ